MVVSHSLPLPLLLPSFLRTLMIILGPRGLSRYYLHLMFLNLITPAEPSLTCKVISYSSGNQSMDVLGPLLSSLTFSYAANSVGVLLLGSPLPLIYLLFILCIIVDMSYLLSFPLPFSVFMGLYLSRLLFSRCVKRRFYWKSSSNLQMRNLRYRETYTTCPKLQLVAEMNL